MSPQIVLFLLRLVGAALLLAFLGLIAWFLFQDLRANRLSSLGKSLGNGTLRIVANSLSDHPSVNTIYELSPVTSIGRAGRNTIVLNDTYVSSDHALLTWRESQWWLEDLGSRNGTQLNEAPLIGAAVVSAGDEFTIGSVKFKLELPGQSDLEGQQSGIRDSNP